MKKIVFLLITVCGIIFNSYSQNNSNEKKIKSFIFSTENTIGWETTSNDISLDFFKDGRLHIQGSDGESTMWEGRWSLKGDKLTMKRPDLEKTITVTAKINGENLVLDNIIYNRYQP
jgi:hypothetical protein